MALLNNLAKSKKDPLLQQAEDQFDWNAAPQAAPAAPQAAPQQAPRQPAPPQPAAPQQDEQRPMQHAGFVRREPRRRVAVQLRQRSAAVS